MCFCHFYYFLYIYLYTCIHIIIIIIIIIIFSTFNTSTLFVYFKVSFSKFFKLRFLV